MGQVGDGQSVINARKGRQNTCVCFSHSYTYTHNADGLRKYLFLRQTGGSICHRVCVLLSSCYHIIYSNECVKQIPIITLFQI